MFSSSAQGGDLPIESWRRHGQLGSKLLGMNKERRGRSERAPQGHLSGVLKASGALEDREVGGKGSRQSTWHVPGPGSWGAGLTAALVGCACVAAAAVQGAEGVTSLLGWCQLLLQT